MNSEYIRLSRPEILYSQKNLLLAVLELLKTSKNLKNYKSLRKEEFMLKVALKSKINILQNSLSSLNQLLPQTNTKLIREEKHMNHEISRALFKKEKPSLDAEIEAIKAKLSRLS